MAQIECSEICEGDIYSEPVFFDDQVNMFLGAYKSARKYHVLALKRWNIPFLYTEGHKLTQTEIEEWQREQSQSVFEDTEIPEKFDDGEISDLDSLDLEELS